MSYSLTVREKEHWKDRIAARIDKRIDALSAEKSRFMEEVEKKARDRAFESAGILKMQQRIDNINKEEKVLDDKSSKLMDEVDKKKRSVDDKIDPLLEKAREEQAELTQQSEKKKRVIVEKTQPALDDIEKQKESLDTRKTQVFRQMLARVQHIPLREVDRDPYNPEWDIERAVEQDKLAEVDRILAASPRGKKILALRTEKENLLDTVWLATSGRQIKELWETVNSLLGNTQTELQRQAAAIPPVEEE